MLSIELINKRNKKEFFEAIQQSEFKKLINLEEVQEVQDYVKNPKYEVFSLRLGSKSKIKYGLAYTIYYKSKEGSKLCEVYYTDYNFVSYIVLWSTYWMVHKFDKIPFVDIDNKTFHLVDTFFEDNCENIHCEKIENGNYRVYGLEF